MTPFRMSILLLAVMSTAAAGAEPKYVKKATRNETLTASLAASELPTLEGKWYWVGPFNGGGGAVFDTEFPPDKSIDLSGSWPGKDKKQVSWQEYSKFKTGAVMNLLDLVPKGDNSIIYLYHEFEWKGTEPLLMPLSVGYDDQMIVFINGKQIFYENSPNSARPDMGLCEMLIRPGKNQLLVKMGNMSSDYAVYLQPRFPKSFPDRYKTRLANDFPDGEITGQPNSSVGEAAHYRIVTLPQPADCVLEVGGLAFRPDGKLMACTRRGEIWSIENATSDDTSKIKFSRFAEGLHEALGLYVQDNKTLYAVQRPELTRIIDRDGDNKGTVFQTVCDKWGCSGDYHEFAFGPVRDKDGNWFVCLNVGFGGGHQAKSPWRGWCVKINPKGEMEPWAYGLRSPNGINFSPEGDLFYCDNQGEWVASNKMHEVRKGEYYGHQASLVWLKESPFYKAGLDKVASGMRYDGEPGANGRPSGFPALTPPCIWFPYGRMGQSVSEPRWDTTGGKFGPFQGQCFVGDQNKSIVMRVALEKVNGRYQGACFPFRSGFQCGVNRLVFAPDGSLMVGETDRGWGSVGGKPYGLQRLVYTGVLPFEIYSMKLQKEGFELTFTKPLDPATAQKTEAYNLTSFTYYYYGNYGCAEIDTRVEKLSNVKISDDKKKVTFKVDGLHKGRIYDLRLSGVKSAEGDRVLHPEAYYTLNDFVP